ncbi:MAG TPA: BON domain-containing protein [Bdellovibrionales bacterium]|nr:BON domain-containing protein [Bdellovibrionales bacterium]
MRRVRQPRRILRTNRQSRMGSLFGTLLFGAIAGSILAFVFDPVSGARRQAHLRDKATRFKNDSIFHGMKQARNIRNRARGAAIRMSKARRDRERASAVDDDTLLSRIRSEMGRKVSHARAVHVRVDEGDVTLTGAILKNEVDGLLAKIAKVPGVRRVINQLDAHAVPGHISGLQGEGKPYLHRH